MKGSGGPAAAIIRTATAQPDVSSAALQRGMRVTALRMPSRLFRVMRVFSLVFLGAVVVLLVLGFRTAPIWLSLIVALANVSVYWRHNSWHGTAS
jgi:hypothetical protein